MNKLLLLILDGWGIGQDYSHNAIARADTPFWDRITKTYPMSTLSAKEDSVGLSRGHLSNSEVGHTAIGAGRVVPQSAFAIDQAIASGAFMNNDHRSSINDHIKKYKGILHLVGMLSDGGVHSHIDHLIALIEWAKKENVKNIVLHLFLDGRDMAPMSALTLLPKLESYLDDDCRIATVTGRAIGMDRTENWDRTVETFRTVTTADDVETSSPTGGLVSTMRTGLLQSNQSNPPPRREGGEEGVSMRTCLRQHITQNYQQNITDEFMPPARFTNDVIDDNDAIIFFNFRADRMRQLVRLFLGKGPHAVQQSLTVPKKLFLASMANYDETFADVRVLFPKIIPTNNLGEWISKQGLKQLRITETEKYAHVTYFLNGGQEIQYPGEERLVIPSLGLKNYASEPQMNLPEVTSSLIRALNQKHFDFIACNGDMVGHSGDFEAACKAAAHVDHALSKIIPSAEGNGYTVVITADHGNIEYMEHLGQPHTAHTFNDVPLIINNSSLKLSPHGHLHQTAPTVLQLMEIECPPEMTSNPLTAS